MVTNESINSYTITWPNKTTVYSRLTNTSQQDHKENRDVVDNHDDRVVSKEDKMARFQPCLVVVHSTVFVSSMIIVASSHTLLLVSRRSRRWLLPSSLVLLTNLSARNESRLILSFLNFNLHSKRTMLKRRTCSSSFGSSSSSCSSSGSSSKEFLGLVSWEKHCVPVSGDCCYSKNSERTWLTEWYTFKTTFLS